jgi:hypothetical protein
VAAFRLHIARQRRVTAAGLPAQVSGGRPPVGPLVPLASMLCISVTDLALSRENTIARPPRQPNRTDNIGPVVRCRPLRACAATGGAAVSRQPGSEPKPGCEPPSQNCRARRSAPCFGWWLSGQDVTSGGLKNHGVMAQNFIACGAPGYTGMEKEMRELDGEGVAIHVGPESCVRVREGAGEALTGVRAGWAIEPRKLNEVRGADAVITGGRQHRQRRYRASLWGPARCASPGS